MAVGLVVGFVRHSWVGSDAITAGVSTFETDPTLMFIQLSLSYMHSSSGVDHANRLAADHEQSLNNYEVIFTTMCPTTHVHII